jgi:4-hydroxy-2-oxoglutarate aldolase
VFLPALLVGAVGGILAAVDAFPEPFIRIWKDFTGGDISSALATQKRMIGPARLVVAKLGVPGIKAAVDLRGLYGGPPRPPLLPAADESINRIKNEIDRLVEEEILDSEEI